MMKYETNYKKDKKRLGYFEAQRSNGFYRGTLRTNQSGI